MTIDTLTMQSVPSRSPLRRACLPALLLVLLGTAPLAAQDTYAERKVESQLRTEDTGAHADAARSLSIAFRVASRKALPAVVFIQTERDVPAGEEEVPDFFRFFFPDQPGQNPQAPGQEAPRRPLQGAGSGFFIDREGHIVTNAHVVADATLVTVELVDGREYDAEVVGVDESSDVALLRVDPEGREVPVVELGHSGRLQVGDWVLALGSPLGLEFTVTAGIVSAKSRQITGRPAALEAFIQTDAAINPGNSGGPLVDLDGRVVGINTAIAGGGSRFVGYGFAIPVDIARKVVNDILQYGHVRRPQLGVSIADLTAVDAEAYGLEDVSGAHVRAITPGTAAEEAGLRPGDVILAVEGEPIQIASDLTTRLAQHQPGDVVTMRYFRDGQIRDLEVELGQFGDDEAPEEEAAPEVPDNLGFQVEPLSPEIAERLGYDRETGVVVRQVTPYGSAANAGLRPGHLILSINGQSVSTPADVSRISQAIEVGSVVSIRLEDPQLGETIVNYRVRP